MQLQSILADSCRRLGGSHVILNSAVVAGFEDNVQLEGGEGRRGIRVNLEDGRAFEGDLLVGADGIWSKARRGGEEWAPVLALDGLSCCHRDPSSLSLSC